MRRFFPMILALLIQTPIVFAEDEGLNFKTSFQSPTPTQITRTGHNRQALFVSDDAIIYVSSRRQDHSGPQIYFRDLTSNKERQITHQIGQLNLGSVSESKNRIIYSGTVDEEQETPFALRKYLERFPSAVNNDFLVHYNFDPQEIYSSKLDGSDIERLTESPGFDSFPFYFEDKDLVYYSSWQNGQLSLFAKALEKNLPPSKLVKTSGHDLGIQVSPNKKHMVWFRFSPDFKSSQVVASDARFKDINYLTLESGINWSPVWHPKSQSVIYSARNELMQDFDLFEVSLDGKCRRQLTSYKGDEFFPAISPDGKRILFTATLTGQEQIHSIPHPGPLPCQKVASR